jgi:hypothetical protein
MNANMKFSVYGKTIIAEESSKYWRLYYEGAQGKNQPAEDLKVPSFIEEDELEEFLSDICHEWVSDRHPDVYRIS